MTQQDRRSFSFDDQLWEEMRVAAAEVCKHLGSEPGSRASRRRYILELHEAYMDGRVILLKPQELRRAFTSRLRRLEP